MTLLFVTSGLLLGWSLGANDAANIFGSAVEIPDIQLGPVTITAARQLFFIGGTAIAIGIVTYSRKVIETVGTNIFELSSEAALVVVLAQSLVLFLFSSVALSRLITGIGLPYLPLVPVSSSQVVIGSILGIGLLKGARNLNFRILGNVAAGWITTPVIAGIVTFFSLFFMENVFKVAIM